jgi:hypothetical protein
MSDNDSLVSCDRSHSFQIRKDFLQLMMKSLNGTGDSVTQKSFVTAPETAEADQSAEDNQGVDIISHMISVGAANEKPQSHNPNYKLSMEVWSCHMID